MEEYVYYTELYDLYKNLLTDKQRVYFEDYYFKNLSFSEISDKYKVSRNAIYNQVRITKELLKDYESKLKLVEKFNEIDNLLNDDEVSKKIRNIIDS